MAGHVQIQQLPSAVVPVTALHSFELASFSLLLSGEGCFTRVFDLTTRRLLFHFKTFESQTVHGYISTSSIGGQGTEVLAWGGHAICLFSVRIADEKHVNVTDSHPIRILLRESFNVPDWTMHASFSPHYGADTTWHLAAVISANNVLSLISFDRYGRLKCRSVGSVSHCMLYSAHVTWISDHRVLVAAGTVFGTIILWSCFLDPDSPAAAESSSRLVTHHIFEGHEGSIFGVDISEVFPVAPEQPSLRFLASCSDDRTIRIWNVSEIGHSDVLTSFTDSYQSQAENYSHYDSGFGNKQRARSHRTGSFSCIATTWAHISRIWGVKFLQSPVEDHTRLSVGLISFGEDATCEQWTLRATLGANDASESFTVSKPSLSSQGVLQRHAGKNIWAVAVDQSGSRKPSVIIGGADGRISEALLFDRCSPESRPKAEVPSGANEISYKSFRLYALLSNDTFVVTAADCRILIARFEKVVTDDTLKMGSLSFTSAVPGSKTYCTSWSEVQYNDKKSPISSLSVCDGTSFVIIASENRTLSILDTSNYAFKCLNVTRGKVAKILTQNLSLYHNYDQAINILVLLTYFGQPCVDVLLIQGDDFGRANIKFSRRVQIPSTFVLTAFLYFNALDIIILGSRSGSYAVVDLPIDGVNSEDIVSSAYECHQDAMVAIVDLAPLGVPMHCMTFSRDGTYAIHHLERNSAGFHLRVLHSACPKVLLQLTRGYIDHKTRSVILEGFQAKDFVIWDETTQTEVARQDVGGVRWPVDFVLYTEPDYFIGRLLYTQTRVPTIVNVKGSFHGHVQSGLSGREIKCVDFRNQESEHLDDTQNAIVDNEDSGPAKEHCGSGHLLAFGGEDCTVQLISLRDKSRVKSVGTFKKHNTGTQAVKWSRDGQYLFSCGGQSEFYAWKCNYVQGWGYGMVFQADIKPKDVNASDVRILDFDIVPRGGFLKEGGRGGIVIALVTSTSCVEVWHFDPYNKIFSLLAETQYTSCAITHITTRIHDTQLLLFIVATDGYAAIYTPSITDFGLGIEPESRQSPGSILQRPTSAIRLHQSAIKAHAIHTVPKTGAYLTLTGGDDNALCVSMFQPTASTQRYCLLKSIPKAHAAAITGIAVLWSRSVSSESTAMPESKRQGFNDEGFALGFVSVGCDSLVKYWRLLIPSSGLRDDNNVEKDSSGGAECTLECLASQRTEVADVAAVASTVENGKATVVVSGVGVEVLEIELPSFKRDFTETL